MAASCCPLYKYVLSMDREAFCTAGYSPFLQFTVQDMDTTLPKLLSMGATMDGPIKYPIEGK
eukprot:scaffold37377_cov46-Prasinocladus_malaysianus.AAC.1